MKKESLFFYDIRERAKALKDCWDDGSFPNWIYRVFWKINDSIFWIKRKKFQFKNGFDFVDVWNFNYSCSKWVLPRLRYLRDNHCGLPMKPNGKITKHGPESFTDKQWNDILDKMIFAFDSMIREDKYLDDCYPKDFDFSIEPGNNFGFKDKRKPDYRNYNRMLEKRKEGFRLFGEWFESLWD